MEDHALCCDGTPLEACDDDAAMGAAPGADDALREVAASDQATAFHRLFRTPLLNLPSATWSRVADHLTDEQSVCALDRVCVSAHHGVRASLDAWSALAFGVGLRVPHSSPARSFSSADVARHAYIEFLRKQTAFQVEMEQVPTHGQAQTRTGNRCTRSLRVHLFQSEAMAVSYRAVLDAVKAAARDSGTSSDVLHGFARFIEMPDADVSSRGDVEYHYTVDVMSGLAAVYAAVQRPMQVVLFATRVGVSISDFLQDIIPDSWVKYKLERPDPYIMNRLTNLGACTMTQERSDSASSTETTEIEVIGLINQSSIRVLFERHDFRDERGRAPDLIITTALPSSTGAISFFATAKDANVPIIGLVTEATPRRSAALRTFVLASSIAVAGVQF